MTKHLPLYILLLLSFLGITVSCADSEYDFYIAPVSSSVAVKTFSLSEDDSVLANLDSVFFSIDLDKRLIYNADSLPKGTDVTKLVAKITFPIVYSANIQVKDGKVMKDSIINYGTNPNDTIDFSGKVTLELVSEDKLSTAVYAIKVNVHKMDPDSLYWNKLARRDLPYISTPLEQKTIEFKNNVKCLVKEPNKYVISTVDNPSTSKWTIEKMNLTFTPNVNSFNATDDAMFLLSDNGDLYTSQNGLDWTACNAKMYSLIGGYENMLVGVVYKDNKYYHAQYVNSELKVLEEVENGFPVSDSSMPIKFATKWGTSSQMIILGGADKNGKPIGECWGYDGNTWGQLSIEGVPAVKGATIFPYFTHKVSAGWKVTKYSTLFAIGGEVAGDVSKKVYISYDNGLHWKVGDEMLQLPDYIPAFKNAQTIILPTTFTSRSIDGWEYYQPKKLPVWNSIIEPNLARNVEVSWDCPYIYMFGGTNAEGQLYDNIWKGVLNRLSFKPLI